MSAIDPQQAMLVVLVGGGGLAAIAASVVSIVTNLRRKPALSEELYKDFATKTEVSELRNAMDTLKRDIENQLHAGSLVFRSLERVIGRLEGILERCPFLCPNGKREEPR